MANKTIPIQKMGNEIDKMMTMASSSRKNFERKWYDNNFFDDGYHFRFISRSTGKIIDLTQTRGLNTPTRAIPKASRQIRGIANLLLQPDYVPVVYPEKVEPANYPVVPDETGQPISPEYLQAYNLAKTNAQRIGHWIMEEWRQQQMINKLMLMVILSAKNSISYIQVWPDAVTEKIKTKVYDAFDIYLMGNYTDIEDSPFLIKAVPMLISEIKANENFDKDQLKKISPDNKYASSEIKQAYMRSRFGGGMTSDNGATLILKEAFIKEYLSEDNAIEVARDFKGEDINKGDIVMRHVFSAGGVVLQNEYLNMKHYPFVDYRFEPGQIYQVPLIERFIPANKSLDMISSRIERWANTMVTGIWTKRKGEDFDISNVPGGQLIEYTAVPPEQVPLQNIPSTMFNYIGFLNQVIEEQGASTSALGKTQPGVKSGVAIESLKASEYANLKIPANMLKKTIKRITKKFIDIASDYYIQPKTIQILEKGEPKYFDIIGQKGLEARKKAEIDIPKAIPITKDQPFNIEVESGLGFTVDGKKDTMQQIVNFILPLAENGIIPLKSVKVMLGKFLDIFKFGSTQEFMEALDQQPEQDVTDQQIQKMKIAVLETLRDAGVVGKEADQKAIDRTKVGVAETLKELNK